MSTGLVMLNESRRDRGLSHALEVGDLYQAYCPGCGVDLGPRLPLIAALNRCITHEACGHTTATEEVSPIG